MSMNEAEYYRKLAVVRARLTEDERRRFDARFPMALERSAVVTYGLGYFLGGLGVDRFRLGHWGRALGKIATYALSFFSLPIWQIVDLFLVGSGTRLSNIERAEQLVRDIQGARPPGAQPPNRE